MVDLDDLITIPRAGVADMARERQSLWLRSTTQHKRGEGKAVPKREEWLTLVVLVSAPGRDRHVVVGHGLFINVAVRIHGDGQLAPAILFPEQGRTQSLGSLVAGKEGLHNCIRGRSCHQGVNGHGAPTDKNQDSGLVECQYLLSEFLLQARQGGVRSVPALGLYCLVISKSQHHNIRLPGCLESRRDVLRLVAADLDSWARDGAPGIGQGQAFRNGWHAGVRAVIAVAPGRIVGEELAPGSGMWPHYGNRCALADRKCRTVVLQ
mmetsp:Transcript_23311/g.52543  ORF Transcript_23311/g.52543 Transcript_23311/m.52543 type:complete len:265 (+) Transcript_23311:407-1201(+)